MTALYLLLLVPAALAGWLARRLPPGKRLAVAATCYVLLVLIAQAIVLRIGDKPNPGAKTYSPSDVARPK